MKNYLFFLASLFAIASVGILPLPAHAAKDGFYAGGIIGAGRTDLDLEAAPPGGSATAFDQAEFDSFEYGALVGYHHNLPRQFFVEAEVDFLFAHGDEGNLFASPLTAEKKHSFGVNVKPGWQWNPNWGAFLVLGWGWAEYEASYSPAGFSQADTGHGFNHGLGVNYHINDKVSLTGEYTRLQTTDIAFAHDPGVLISRWDPELDTIKLALKYHF